MRENVPKEEESQYQHEIRMAYIQRYKLRRLIKLI